MADTTTNVRLQSDLHGLTVQVITYANQLCAHQDLAETFLETLGDGRWNMGATTSHEVAAEPGSPLLSRYLADVVSVLLGAIDARAKAIRPRAHGGTLASLFVLNQVAYLRREVLSTAIGDVLGEGAENALNKRHRTAKAAYLENFSPLVSCLMDAGVGDTGLAGALKGAAGIGGGSEKREVKDRLHRFSDALAEVEAAHRGARIDPSEVELRERIKGELEKMVIPSASRAVSAC